MSATMTAPPQAQQFPGAVKLLASIPPHRSMPPDIQAKLAMAETLLKSGLCPAHFRSKESIFVALQYGDELGMGAWESVRNIYVVNGKPTCDTNTLRGLAEQYSLMANFRVVERTDSRCIVRARRPGEAEEHEGAFTFDEAKRAGLTGKDNWRGYPADMLFARATGRLLKVVSPRVIGGLPTREEAEDEEKAPAPAWQMTAKVLGEMRAIVKARDVPPEALKTITKAATFGRKVDAIESIPQYTEGEATTIIAALKAWRPAPTTAQQAAPAPTASANTDPSPEEQAEIRAQLEAEAREGK